MKNRFYSLLISLTFIFGLSSCIEVFETAHFNKNGSGNIEIKTDYSKLVQMMEALQQNAEAENGEEASLADKLEETFTGQAAALKAIEGISKVSVEFNKEENYSILKYDFANIDALNRGMNSSDQSSVLSGMGGAPKAPEPGNFRPFEMKKGMLMRNFRKTDSGKEPTAEQELADQNMEMAKTMMGDSKYHFNYSFEGRVKKTTGDLVKVNSDRKSISAEIPFLDLVEKQDKMSFTVKLK